MTLSPMKQSDESNKHRSSINLKKMSLNKLGKSPSNAMKGLPQFYATQAASSSTSVIILPKCSNKLGAALSSKKKKKAKK